ncbi:MAG: 1-acyl-sn-glycerol-3-phosphate acyltransferase [Gammaproteobacteria bacterium]|nr:1-acyl-sn-glycerol-3-phosphate acyltransferase [Gammaproteobacteria bacterium]
MSRSSAEPQTRQVSRLYVYWVQILTGFATVKACLKTIWLTSFSNQHREKMDEVTRQWARSLLEPIGLRINLHNPHGQQFESNKRIILMCNHTSLYDIPVSFLAIPGSIRMLTKMELFKIPLLATAMTRSDFVSIDRHNKEQAIKDLKNAKNKLERGIIIWIAPEGTRSKNGQLGNFKKGGFHLAIETNAIIVPIIIRGIEKILPSNTYKLTINGEVDVTIGKAFNAIDFSLNNRKKLMESVRSEMLNILEKS